MITSEPIFESREAADRFCVEVKKNASQAEVEFGKVVAWSGLINAVAFVTIVPLLILKGLIKNAENTNEYLLFVEQYPIILRITGMLVGAAILRSKFLDKRFEVRAARFSHLDSLTELGKPIGPYTLWSINQMVKTVVHADLRLDVSSDGKLEFMTKSGVTYGALLVASAAMGLVLFYVFRVGRW